MLSILFCISFYVVIHSFGSMQFYCTLIFVYLDNVYGRNSMVAFAWSTTGRARQVQDLVANSVSKRTVKRSRTCNTERRNTQERKFRSIHKSFRQKNARTLLCIIPLEILLYVLLVIFASFCIRTCSKPNILFCFHDSIQ